MALWNGRFENDMDEMVKEFNASIGFDKRMYNEDIDGSIAHVSMLAACGIISEEDSLRIKEGLSTIRKKIESGEIVFTVEDEDIHMGIESRLIEEIGDTGKKLHTARSRNDQVQLDVRLYTRRQIEEILEALTELEEVILRKAEEYADELMAGYTHIQHAQPITVGFWFMAYFQMFKRDIERLRDCFERMNWSPLGSCALAGTTFPTDRRMTAEQLGFYGPTENAMDSVSDRDYIIEFLSCAATSMMHISRWAEEIVWWNSTEFAFIDIDDSFTTGSSIMPQKKNPDIAELLRGKSGRVYGHLMSMLTVMKGTPLAFNKDFQEDKEGLYDTADTWKASVRILARMLDKMEFRREKISSQLSGGFLNATDVAEHLASEGIPFREAHNIVGRMVKACEAKGCRLEELDDAALKEVDARLSRAMLGDISIGACVEARKSFGGTSPAEVRRQIAVGREWLGLQ